MEILTANYRQIEKICELYEQFFAFNAAQQPDYYKVACERGSYPKAIIDSELAELFVAVENDAVVGILHIAEDETPPFDCFVSQKFATIIDLFVMAKCRNRAIGASLLERAKKWAKDRKLSYIELSVLENNAGGIGFYERENFEELSKVMRYRI